MLFKFQRMTNTPSTGADSEILKREGALCRPPWLAGEKKFKVSDGLKRPK